MNLKNIDLTETKADETLFTELNISEQPQTPQNARSARKVQGVKVGYSKTDPRYWLKGSRLFKHKGSSTYSFQVQFRKDRRSFPTHCSEKAAAAKTAAKINLEIVHHGMEEVLAKYRPQKEASKVIATVGEWISAAKPYCDADDRSYNCYASSLRSIVAHICKIKKEKERFGPKSGGASDYRSKVDSQSLEVLTPANLQLWKSEYVAHLKKGQTKKNRMNSCNSTMRQAKSLFGKEVVRLVPNLVLPSPVPFEGLNFYPKQNTRYQSKMDHKIILARAQEQLASQKTPVFLAVILGIGAGLRRAEIDRLKWDDIHPDKGIIYPDGTKTAQSSDMVSIDEGLATLLSNYKEVATSEFVIESKKTDYGVRSWGYKYRADAVLDAAIEWLRENGIEVQKPLHELRKEMGSLVQKKHGLYGASVALRHSSPTITAAHYLDVKTPPTNDIGGFLDLSKPIAAPQSQKSTVGKSRKKK